MEGRIFFRVVLCFSLLSAFANGSNEECVEALLRSAYQAAKVLPFLKEQPDTIHLRQGLQAEIDRHQEGVSVAEIPSPEGVFYFSSGSRPGEIPPAELAVWKTRLEDLANRWGPDVVALYSETPDQVMHYLFHITQPRPDPCPYDPRLPLKTGALTGLACAAITAGLCATSMPSPIAIVGGIAFGCMGGLFHGLYLHDHGQVIHLRRELAASLIADERSLNSEDPFERSLLSMFMAATRLQSGADSTPPTNDYRSVLVTDASGASSLLILRLSEFPSRSLNLGIYHWRGSVPKPGATRQADTRVKAFPELDP